MADDDIPFDRSMAAKPGAAVAVSPLVRRIIAPNGGPFTFTGTCTYLVGHRDIAVIDPGPADRQHLAALLSAIGDAAVRAILVTHTHKDHAPGAIALAQATGAPVVGCAPFEAPPSVPGGDAIMVDAWHDPSYAPARILADGDTVEGPDYSLTAVATPGHTRNHLAFAFPAENTLFSGDHVMAWSTTVVAPPDGSMRAYLASLERLQGRGETLYWPGHGGPVQNPQRFIRALAHHRRQREHTILGRLRAGDTTVASLVRTVYADLAPALRAAAGLTVLAHLEDLCDRGLVRAEGGPGLAARYRPEV